MELPLRSGDVLAAMQHRRQPVIHAALALLLLLTATILAVYKPRA